MSGGFVGDRMAVAIRADGHGDVTGSHVLWRYKWNSFEVPSPLVYGGAFFLMDNGGILRTIDQMTGEVLKEGRVREAIDTFYASPVVADGRVYFVSETGKVAVVTAGGQWETVAVSDLGEPAYATPAIVDGSIYLRTETALYSFHKPN